MHSRMRGTPTAKDDAKHKQSSVPRTSSCSLQGFPIQMRSRPSTGLPPELSMSGMLPPGVALQTPEHGLAYTQQYTKCRAHIVPRSTGRAAGRARANIDREHGAWHHRRWQCLFYLMFGCRDPVRFVSCRLGHGNASSRPSPPTDDGVTGRAKLGLRVPG
ncbi:hypothetical protein CC80DRAFT_187498 [Byssothecium circinans]|uniref:Uncharacterized protein n=1 Tax=Byssothecium circinans TaxID=147558 RepID=A0A6A5TI54_9PLEO|nr:hypothetical protein CC80DRAFT_187498 [Byssothecium circinans]